MNMIKYLCNSSFSCAHLNYWAYCFQMSFRPKTYCKSNWSKISAKFHMKYIILQPLHKPIPEVRTPSQWLTAIWGFFWQVGLDCNGLCGQFIMSNRAINPFVLKYSMAVTLASRNKWIWNATLISKKDLFQLAINTLELKQNVWHFVDGNFTGIFLEQTCLNLEWNVTEMRS